MSRLVKIIIKLILSIAAAVAIIYKAGDTFSKVFAGDGAFHTFLGAVGVTMILAGMIYTAITIFWFLFSKERFALILDGLPMPFLLKLIAGIVGIFVWIWFASFLGEKFGGNSRLFDAFALIVYYPMFFWIDLFILIIEKLSQKTSVQE